MLDPKDFNPEVAPPTLHQRWGGGEISMPTQQWSLGQDNIWPQTMYIYINNPH